jgi:hypothetical protein
MSAFGAITAGSASLAAAQEEVHARGLLTKHWTSNPGSIILVEDSPSPGPPISSTVNNGAEIVAQSNLPGDLTFHPFLWTKSVGMQGLGTLGADTGTTNWISAIAMTPRRHQTSTK